LAANPVKPLRRRAKQVRARETIAVIREAAAQVLLRHGYARATTNRIAELAGVSVGTIYQYFKDKDAVFDALIRGEIEDLKQRLVDAAPDPKVPLTEALRNLLSSIISARPEAPALYRALEQVRTRCSDAAFPKRAEMSSNGYENFSWHTVASCACTTWIQQRS
jgi:AcrR family transcriptional regulator